jgi:hypothetical protein
MIESHVVSVVENLMKIELKNMKKVVLSQINKEHNLIHLSKD